MLSVSFLKIQLRCVRVFGYLLVKTNIFIQLYAAFNWLSLILITVPEGYYVIENLGNIRNTTDGLATLLTVILSISKIATIFFQREKFLDLIDATLKLYQDASEDEKIIMNRTNNTDRLVTISYLSATVCTGIYYLSIPIFLAIYDIYTLGAADSKIMPMQSSFPFSIQGTFIYIILYCWFTYETMLTMFAAVGVDTLFSGLSFHLCAHFQIIQKRFSEFNYELLDDSKTAKKSLNYNQLIMEKLKPIINYHKCVIEQCENLRDTHKPAIIAQFLITSLLMCVIGYQLTLSIGEFIMVKYIIYLVAILLQLFMYSYGGTQITYESAAVADAVYTGKWYITSPKVRQDLVLCIMRAQKYNIISAGFWDASLTTYRAILSAAGSYITLLQTLEQK